MQASTTDTLIIEMNLHIYNTRALIDANKTKQGLDQIVS